MLQRSFVLLLLLAPAAAAQDAVKAPAFDAEWIGFDASQADTARWPRAFRAGDLDGDGDLDYAVSHGASMPAVTVHLNRGDGSFEDPAYHDTPGSFWEDLGDLELGDLDRDGDLDVVVANHGNAGTSERIFVLRNLGAGTLGAAETYPTGEGPQGVELADLDGDGWLDVVVTLYGYIGQGSQVAIHRNDGAGGLLPAVNVTVAASPWRVEAGDLDGDGDQDLAVACEAETISVLLNQGGGFARQDYQVFATPWETKYQCGVALGDVDGDGDLDMAYTSNKCGFESFSGAGAIGVLHNAGDGSFGAPLKLATLLETQGGASVTLADWNRDGRLDVASAHEFDGEWMVFASNASGGYDPPQRFFAAASALQIDASDVDGDGHPDLVVLGRDSLELCVYRNPGDGEFFKDPYHVFKETISGIFDPIVSSGLSAADIDGDGDLDLGMSWAKIQGLNGGQAILRNLGGGAFQNETYDTPAGAANFAFADVDVDGDPDMLSTDAFSSRLRRRFNDGAGVFGPETAWPFAGVDDLGAADLDGDGDPDAAGVSWGTLSVARNDGGGGFAQVAHFDLATFGDALAIGDVDLDGDLDVFTNTHNVGCETSLNQGGGTFAAPIPAATDWAPKNVALADVDADGTLDAVVTCWSDDAHGHGVMQTLHGYGDGGFAPPKTYLGSHQIGTSSNAGEIAVVDHDGDGDLDVTAANYWSNDVSTWENLGDGTFGPQVRYASGPSSWGAVGGDFDGDGFDDVAIGITIGPAIDFYPAAVILESNGTGAWVDLGYALKGAAGAARLAGTTPLEPGVPVTLSLADGPANAVGGLVFGLSPLVVPILGGTLVPSPDVIVPLATDASGAAAFTTTWPAGLPVGGAIHAQAWTFDPSGAAGFSASNALRGTQL
jgi:hypothetical protein